MHVLRTPTIPWVQTITSHNRHASRAWVTNIPSIQDFHIASQAAGYKNVADDLPNVAKEVAQSSMFLAENILGGAGDSAARGPG